MTARNLTEDERWKIADRLDKVPSACWADLCNWAVFAAEVEEDDDPDDYVPSTTGGARCAMDAVRDRSCYCGKFRTGLELAESLPVHELAFAAEPSRWLPSIEPASLLDTVAEAMGDDDA